LANSLDTYIPKESLLMPEKRTVPRKKFNMYMRVL